MSVYFPARRPRPVTLVIWGVILFGIWNGSKAVVLAQKSGFLLTQRIQPDPRFQSVMATIWAFLFFAVAWFLWQKRPFTRLAVPLLHLIYGLYTVGIRWLYSPLSVDQRHWLLSGSFFLVTTILVYLSLNRTKGRQYFLKRREEI